MEAAERAAAAKSKKRPPGSRKPAALLTDAMNALQSTEFGNHCRPSLKTNAVIIALVDVML